MITSRALGIAVAGIALCLALSAGAQVPVPGDAWPMFRGSPVLWGVSGTQLPKALKLRWSYQAKDSLESSPAVVDGTVYVGSMDSNLYAIDLATGNVRWQYQTSGPVEESSPCVRGGVVYVGDLGGVFHAVDAATGKARWTFKANDEIKSSPSWDGNRIYFGSYDQNLYCLSADNGDADLEVSDRRSGPLHSGDRQRHRLHLRLRRKFPRHRGHKWEAALRHTTRRIYRGFGGSGRRAGLCRDIRK